MPVTSIRASRPGIADHRDGAAEGERAQRLAGEAAADAVDHDIDALAAGQAHHAVLQPLPRQVDDVLLARLAGPRRLPRGVALEIAFILPAMDRKGLGEDQVAPCKAPATRRVQASPQ
jgi:hypothetical protein